MPVLFGIAFTGLQAGLYYYGRSAAMSAATTGARAAAAENGSSQACGTAAQAFLDQLGDVLIQPSVTCIRTTTTVTVEVSGDTLSVIPGWIPRVSQVATAPVERVT